MRSSPDFQSEENVSPPHRVAAGGDELDPRQPVLVGAGRLLRLAGPGHFRPTALGVQAVGVTAVNAVHGLQTLDDHFGALERELYTAYPPADFAGNQTFAQAQRICTS
jgi:hypothetical protein